MTTAAPPRRTSLDRAFDDTLERLRQLVTTMRAVREVHRPVLQHRGPLRRSTRVCRECHASYPCATLRILRESPIGGM